MLRLIRLQNFHVQYHLKVVITTHHHQHYYLPNDKFINKINITNDTISIYHQLYNITPAKQNIIQPLKLNSTRGYTHW